jgi:LacI family transcriptional regulator
MSDVARRARLSRSQVSNYFNNPDLVSADARQRISAAIAELGYTRDEAASALRRGTTQMLGLLLLDGWAPYFAELSQAINDEAERRGWYLQVANSSRNENRELRHLNYFEAYRTRGIIVAPQGDISARLEQLTRRGMVCVLLDPPHNHPAPDAIPSVAVDHVSPSAADHIVRLPAAERPDGLLAANDLVAIGLMHALTNAGLRVPRDIRLMGYDDIDMAAELATPLSTIRQPTQQLGTTAVHLVIEQIDGTTSGETPHVVLQPELVVRATT